METILEQWFTISQDDLDVALHCISNFSPKKYAIACYHCQQSAEKALKAFLMYCDIEPPKTHNLSLLCEMC
jgi:HEPN domain-containing protein